MANVSCEQGCTVSNVCFCRAVPWLMFPVNRAVPLLMFAVYRAVPWLMFAVYRAVPWLMFAVFTGLFRG